MAEIADGAEDLLVDAIRRGDPEAAATASLAGDAWAHARAYQRLYVEAATERDRYLQAIGDALAEITPGIAPYSVLDTAIHPDRAPSAADNSETTT